MGEIVASEIEYFCSLAPSAEEHTLRAALASHSSRRVRRFYQVLLQRTRYCTVIVEDLHVPHNISAILRTCDGLGIQDVHILERRHRASISPSIEKGSAQWLTLHHHRVGETSPLLMMQHLRNRGYRLVATTPHQREECSNPMSLDITSPVAIVLGNELHGLSDTLLSAADACLHLPLYGFVESYNISVAAAMVLFPLMQRVRSSTLAWQLTATEQLEIVQQWAKRAMPPT